MSVHISKPTEPGIKFVSGIFDDLLARDIAAGQFERVIKLIQIYHNLRTHSYDEVLVCIAAYRDMQDTPSPLETAGDPA